MDAAGLRASAPAESGEPPAPDAEPAVESAPPEEPPAPETNRRRRLNRRRRSPRPSSPSPRGPCRSSCPAPGLPPRALATGSEQRDYPLLRGGLVKLAHDDPATAAALLVARSRPRALRSRARCGYDLTIREAGTFAVGIAGGRASVEQIEAPRSRSVAEFHLTADAVVLCELLAGVEHRIGRFFGPARVRGRKRRVKELRPLATSTATVAEVARAGARLDPGLVYRLLAYAVHPTWTRGHDFTIAQEITGAPPETWYLTARDGAGVTVTASPRPRRRTRRSR